MVEKTSSRSSFQISFSSIANISSMNGSAATACTAKVLARSHFEDFTHSASGADAKKVAVATPRKTTTKRSFTHHGSLGVGRKQQQPLSELLPVHGELAH